MATFFGKMKPEDEKKKNPISGVAKVLLRLAALPIAVKVVLFATVAITVLGISYSIFHLGTDDNSSKNNAETIYDMIASQDKNLHDLITIAGDESSGYYLAFKEGSEERIDEIIKEFSKPNYQTVTSRIKQESGLEKDQEIDRNILLDIIKSELITQYPNLGGIIGKEANIKIAQDSIKEYDASEKMTISKIYREIDDTSAYASVAMVLSYLTEEDIKEKDIYEWSKKPQFDEHYFANDEGEEKFFTESAKEWDAGEVMKIQNKFVVVDALKAGRPVIAKVNHTTNYLFTNEIDYIVLRGIDEDGKKVYVNNANKEKSEGLIDFEKDIHSEAECYFIYNSKQGLEEAEEAGNSSNSSENSSNVDSLDGFLFIGDSITEGLRLYSGIAENVTFKSVTSVGSDYWIEHFSEIEKVDNVKGINVFLGTNDYGNGIGKLKELLEKLHNQFNSVPIFVDGLLPDNQASANKDERDSYTKDLKKYCEEKDYLTFIDVSNGVEITENDCHPKQESYKTLLNNLKEAILRGKTEPTVSTKSNKQERLIIAEDTGNGLDGLQGAIRIRRITPNKPLGELKNVGTGPASTVDVSTGEIAGDIKSYVDGINDGTWAVYAQELNTGKIVANINGSKKLQSASLIKLFILATAYQDMKDSGTQFDKEELKKMITVSSNEAANNIIKVLTFDKINNWITSNGYEKTTIGRTFRRPITRWR